MLRKGKTVQLVGIMLILVAMLFPYLPVKLQGNTIVADSGHASDIQAALNLASPGDNVFIPAGTHNFYEPGETWQPVSIPPGVNLFGAPTERTSGMAEPHRGMNPNDQVVEWKTILTMPMDVPGAWLSGGQPYWFTIQGDNTTPQRVSDIKLVGYRSIDPSSTTLHRGISIRNVPNFRVDHCYFENICGGAIGSDGVSTHGVIDHCFFYNHPRYTVAIPWYACTTGYGITIYRTTSTDPAYIDPIEQVYGHYTDYTVFVEDCWFKGWRHCITSMRAAHWVARKNTFFEGPGMGETDAHGNTPGTMWGTRAIEVYWNEYLDCLGDNGGIARIVHQHRGGAMIMWDNYATPLSGGKGYQYQVTLINENNDGRLDRICDTYLWANEGNTAISNNDPSDVVFERDYFEREPSIAQDGLEYSPYTYPHPLTVQG